MHGDMESPFGRMANAGMAEDKKHSIVVAGLAVVGSSEDGSCLLSTHCCCVLTTQQVWCRRQAGCVR
jgi:hypothetical protein